jgi:hypothetical protein
MAIRIHNPYPLAIFLALFFACTAALLKFVIFAEPAPAPPLPEIGKAGTTHAHASLLFMIGDSKVDFCQPKYMLKSDIAHFEDNDCFTVHKHALGVTIMTFLDTIGVKLTDDCLLLPQASSTQYCSDNVKSVRVVYNGDEVKPSALKHKEIKNNDHVLIYYGSDTDLALRFKYNQVPNIPTDVNEPLLEQ